MIVCDVCGYRINEPNPLCDHRGRRPSGATTDAEDAERLTQQLEKVTAQLNAAKATARRNIEECNEARAKTKEANRQRDAALAKLERTEQSLNKYALKNIELSYQLAHHRDLLRANEDADESEEE